MVCVHVGLPACYDAYDAMGGDYADEWIEWID
jgi:hypothetical protein